MGVDAWHQKALDAMEKMDRQRFMKAWMPGGLAPLKGNEAWEQLQNAFWSAMPHADGEAGK